MNLAAIDSKAWSNRDFEGKATLAYLWASRCGPACGSALSVVQQLHDKLKRRPDLQVVTLSVDEDPAKLAAFMKDKGYTFPVLASKPYVERVLPKFMLGQFWMVDGKGSVRLWRGGSVLGGAESAFVDEAIYKLRQLLARGDL